MRLPFVLAVAVLLPVSPPLSANGQTLPVSTRGKASFDPKTGVYAPPPPDREPEYHKGQKFIVLNTTLLNYLEPRDKTKDIRLQVLTLKDYDLMIPDALNGNPDLYGVSLNFEEIPPFGTPSFGTSQMGSERIIDDLPMKPVIKDDDVRFLQKKYEGKIVYPYGNVAVSAIPKGASDTTQTTLQFNYRSPMRMLRIVRIRTSEVTLALTDTPDRYQKTYSRLVIVLEPLKGSAVVAFSISNSRTTRKNSGYAGYYVKRFAPWDFEKTFSLSSPAHIAKLAPPKLGKALLAGELRGGMTGEMVVRICGFPPNNGSRVGNFEFLSSEKNADWWFPTTPPFSFIVKFEKGKAVSWGDNGRLP